MQNKAVIKSGFFCTPTILLPAKTYLLFQGENYLIFYIVKYQQYNHYNSQPDKLPLTLRITINRKHIYSQTPANTYLSIHLKFFSQIA